MQFILSLFLLVFLTGSAEAGEMSLFGGIIQELGSSARSYGWQLDYAVRPEQKFKYSVSYLNEGHATTNHRDGVLAQVWACPVVVNRKLFLETGLGPYYFFDTHNAGSRAEDVHGWGGIVSLAGTWNMKTPWFFQVRMNWIGTRESDTLSTSLGIGYRLDSPNLPVFQAPAAQPAMKNEITLFFGDTIVNNPDRSGHYSYAESLEYRRKLGHYVEWSAAWLHENKNHLIDRNGVTMQLWAVSSCFADRTSLGFGLGPYLAVDRMRQRDSGKVFASGVATFTAAFRFSTQWTTRLSWSRIITDYDRDSDLIMLGLGRRF